MGNARKPKDGIQTGNQVKAEVIRPEPKRCDQHRCPVCGEYGCPAANGTKSKTEGVYRYRKCGACGWVFITLQRHGQAEEHRVA